MILSKEQEILAHTDSKKALGLAPAGSGKTRVLIARIEHLIKNKNVSPYEILSFSFTRKAAGEIKKRLENQIGPASFNVTCGTIHGCALNYLQRFGELAGLNPGKITVYGGWEEQFLLKEVAKEIGYHTGYKWKKVKKGDVDAAFRLFYTTGAWGADSEDENTIMKAFFAQCRENNALTYGMILTTFLKIIPEITQYLNLQHVLADEVQDLNPIQWEIINQLSKNGSLFAIGDPNQAIYKFQGGDAEYLIRNKHLFDVYHLRDNYRSSANIVEAANRLISHNPLNISEDMVAIRSESRSVASIDNMNSDQVVKCIKNYLLKFFTEDIAVIARNHWMLESLSKKLTQANINHQYVGKTTTFVKSEEFRRFHAFLNLIVNPMDNFSFLLVKDYLVDKDQYAEIRLLSVQESESHYQEWCKCWIETEDWKKWLKASESTDFHTVIDWMKDIPFRFDTDPIFNFVYSWLIANPNGTIDQYLTWLATFDSQDEIDEDVDCLQLLSMHSSKGLEFSTVIILGLNEGIFPSNRSIKSNELLEELRLAYVAMTRSEDQLILTSRPVEKDESGEISNEPSRFIEWAINP